MGALKKQRIKKVCPNCNRIFEVRPSANHIVCCSRMCSDVLRKGKYHPCKTPEIEKERRRKMSVAGKKLWENSEYREKTQSSMKKKRLSEKHKEKLREIGFKQTTSEQKRKKCRLINLGKPKTEEHKIKISAIRQGIPIEEWVRRVTPLYHEIRYCTKYYEWRNLIYERDNFCDWFSGVRGNGNLNAHHIIPFNFLLERNNITTFEQAMECEALWDINNGITMIDTNHNAYHSMWG
jgi:endogenous inhibitor of DNA gyrase (YacG/DUF329 family)